MTKLPIGAGMLAGLVPLLLCSTASSGQGIPPLAPAPQHDSRSVLDARLAGQKGAMAIDVVGDRREVAASKGMADPDRRIPLTVDTPLRVASNTKTFTAATILRLWEQGRLDLDAPIGPLVDPAIDRLLRGDGYDTGRITIRHLLSHSGGLYDHGSDPRFAETFMADPRRHWTPIDLLRLMVEYADPQDAPGVAFRYSDDDYILLGNIIERTTRKTLAAAVRDELNLDRLGLSSTWWEQMESPPRGAKARARQYLGTVEATDVDASIDLYGGGGLVMSARDLARFFKALFEGRVFERPQTLREMLWQGPHKGADQYRLGIFVKHADGRDIYWHSGFWGTIAYYDPRSRIAAAGVTTDQDNFRALVPIVQEAAGIGKPTQPR